MAKILIVEDEKAMLRVLVQKFTQEGFTVLQAGDGQEGLSVALAEKPDLLLLDLLMPKMSGAEMLRKVRESGEWGAKVPTIILTNFDRDEKTAWSTTNLKPTKYLVKVDVKIEDIVASVRAALS